MGKLSRQPRILLGSWLNIWQILLRGCIGLVKVLCKENKEQKERGSIMLERS